MTPAPPRIGGIAGGVGTSIVAALIDGEDVGRVSHGGDVEVLVCRSTASSVAAAIAAATAAEVRPALVVVDDRPGSWPAEVVARFRSADIGSKVRLRWVDPLRSAADPPTAAATSVWAKTDRPAKWIFALREDRDQIIRAVIEVITTRAEHASAAPPGAPDVETDAAGFAYRAG